MFKKIQPDKWRHFFVGLAMGLLFESLLHFFFPSFAWLGSAIVLSLIVILSYGFELTSLVFKIGHYDVLDAVAGVIGGIAGMAVAYLIFW